MNFTCSTFAGEISRKNSALPLPDIVERSRALPLQFAASFLNLVIDSLADSQRTPAGRAHYRWAGSPASDEM